MLTLEIFVIIFIFILYKIIIIFFFFYKKKISYKVEIIELYCNTINWFSHFCCNQWGQNPYKLNRRTQAISRDYHDYQRKELLGLRCLHGMSKPRQSSLHATCHYFWLNAKKCALFTIPFCQCSLVPIAHHKEIQFKCNRIV